MLTPLFAAQFPKKMHLREMADLIVEQVGKIDEQLKKKVQEMQTIQQQVHAINRKSGGNLMARDIAPFVKAAHVIEQRSDFLCTVFVVVPIFETKEWEASYETLTPFVVPKSGNRITEDKEYALYGVWAMVKKKEDLLTALRDRRYTVRDFSFEATSVDTDVKMLGELNSKIDRMKAHLSAWCKTNFSEAYIHYTHMKAIGLFIEAVLRYGLGAGGAPCFSAAVLAPKPRMETKMKDTLGKAYAHLSSDKAFGGDEEAVSGIGGQGEYTPYATFSVNTYEEE